MLLEDNQGHPFYINHRFPSIQDYFNSVNTSIGQGAGLQTAPANIMLQEQFAHFEKASKTLLLNSAMAGVANTVLTFVQYGGHMVAHHNLQGYTEIFLHDYLPTFGIRLQYVDFTDYKKLKSAVTPHTKLLFAEIPAGPTLDIVDIQVCSEIARESGAVLAIDHSLSTYASIKPLELGADVSIFGHTNYLGNLHFGYVAGSHEYISEIGNYSQILGNKANFDFSSILQNLPALEMRIEKHSQNAIHVARFLASHPKVSKISYPGLKQHEGYNLAKKQLKNFGGIIGFWLKANVQEIFHFLNNLQVCYISPIIGDSVTTLEYPAAMSYLGVNQGRKSSLAVTDNFLRISVGLEDVDSILRDLDQALSFQ